MLRLKLPCEALAREWFQASWSWESENIGKSETRERRLNIGKGCGRQGKIHRFASGSSSIMAIGVEIDFDSMIRRM